MIYNNYWQEFIVTVWDPVDPGGGEKLGMGYQGQTISQITDGWQGSVDFIPKCKKKKKGYLNACPATAPDPLFLRQPLLGL